MRKIQKAVVTGGAGFIGSHVTEALLASGAEVLVIDNLSSGSRSNFETFADRSKLKFSEADIGSKEAAAAIAEFKPQALFHLAAQMNVRVSVKDPLLDASTNVVGLINVVDAFRQSGGEVLLFSSTGGAIYGEQDYFPADEEHPIHAESPYGVSKRCGELYLEYFARTSKLAAVALRFANVYGPRQNAKGEAGVISIFCERLLRGETLQINGSGEQTRDFVYVKDVVAAMLICAEHAEVGFDVFNVGTETETSLLTLADAVRDSWKAIRSETDPEVADVIHGPALPGEQLRSSVKTQKLRARYNWNVSTDLSSGLRLTLDSFRQASASRSK